MTERRVSCYGSRVGLGLVLLALAVRPALAQSSTPRIVAPLGGQPVPLGSHRTLCATANELGGWRLEAGGSRIRPPDIDAAPGALRVRTAQGRAHCAESNELIELRSIATWPTFKPDSLIVNVDDGLVDVVGTGLKDLVLSWRVGEASGTDTCRDPQLVGGEQACAFAVSRELIAEPQAWSMTLLPPGVPSAGDVSAFDARGRAINLGRFSVHPDKLVVIDLLPPDASLDAEAEVARLALKHPEAIAQAECREGSCTIEGKELVVKNPSARDDAFDVRMVMRPRIFVQGATQLQSAPSVAVPLQRCPLSLASAAPLRNVAGQKVVVAVGGRCQEAGQLRFFIGGSQARQLLSRQEGDRTFVVLTTDAVLGDEMQVVVQHRNSTAGLVRARTRQLPNARPRIELSGFGEIDFIPTNRDAEVILPNLSPTGQLVPVPLPGIYQVTLDQAGSPKVRGTPGAAGWVALRLAYRDPSLPAALRDINLAEFADTVDRNIHQASIPVTLGASANANSPLVELLCEHKDHPADRLMPGKPISISFDHKDACRLVLHRERLAPEDGDQMVRVSVNVAALDGTNRPEAAVDQRLLLRPSHEPRVLWLTGVAAPFDRMVVRVSVVTQELHDAVAPQSDVERISLPQVQWALTVGNSHLRLYATTALPTGLFRVADKHHSGLMGLNAGILARLVVLTRSGMQWPVGLELGTMVLGITGDTTPSPNGHVGVVGGLSLSVPIANVSRMTQASISLHIWGEYEISRALMTNAGTPWGFVFGPSLSFGDVGINL